MKLISCPACNAEVSDQAPQCVSCGHPIGALQKKYGLIWIIFWLIIFFPVAIVMIVINMNGGRATATESSKQIASWPVFWVVALSILLILIITRG